MTVRESRFADSFTASLGFAGGHYAARRAFAAIIVHTAGGGIVKRFIEQGHDKGDATPFDTALRVYSRVMGASSGFAAPHYVVGQGGECAQMCKEELATHHVGSKAEVGFRRMAASKLYRLPRLVWAARAGWWLRRWPDYASPLELADGTLWAGGSCNANTVAVEVVPDRDRPQGPWSPACWDKLGDLLHDIAERRAIPWERARILTHSDAHPVARTAKGEPWDPRPEQWDPAFAWPILGLAA